MSSEANGSNARMDRVEATLERVGKRLDRMSERMERHVVDFDREINLLVTENRQVLKEHEESFTRKLDDWVTANSQALEEQHEKFDDEMNKLLKAQVILRADMEHWWAAQKKRDAALDERIDKLVSAIGAFVSKSEGTR